MVRADSDHVASGSELLGDRWLDNGLGIEGCVDDPGNNLSDLVSCRHHFMLSHPAQGHPGAYMLAHRRTKTTRRPLPSQNEPRQVSRRVTAALDDLGVAEDGSWATLRHAESVTGVAASTIRNWARKGKIASRLDQGRDGPRRMVLLDDVVNRASRLDTPLAPVAKAGAVTSGGTPEGHLLVPLDSWERMLIQLGNLHEAGQQLADAKERAGKAETESGFLRERLVELRTERDQLRERVGDFTRPPERAPEPAPVPTAATGTKSLWRRIISELRSRPKW